MNQPTITKEEIARGYDAITEKIIMRGDFYEQCLSMHSPYTGSILDLGCGQGILLKMMRERSVGATSFTGLDISPKLCEIARTNNPGAHIDVGDIENMTFESNTFDIITMTEVLEHMLDYDKALAEVNRVLKPGGTFIVSVPNRDWASYDFYDKIRDHSMQPVDDHYFRFQEVSDYLTNNGFEIKKYKGLDNLYYYGWKHKIEELLAFFVPMLNRKMKRLVFACTKRA